MPLVHTNNLMIATTLLARSRHFSTMTIDNPLEGLAIAVVILGIVFAVLALSFFVCCIYDKLAYKAQKVERWWVALTGIFTSLFLACVMALLFIMPML